MGKPRPNVVENLGGVSSFRAATLDERPAASDMPKGLFVVKGGTTLFYSNGDSWEEKGGGSQAHARLHKLYSSADHSDVDASVARQNGQVLVWDFVAQLYKTGLPSPANGSVTADKMGPLNKGIIICTSTTRPPSAVEGQHIYETDTDATLKNTGTPAAPVWSALGGSGVPSSEAWIVPTLLNGWVNFGGTISTAAYYKDPLGIVHLKGTIKSGTMGAAAFTLPVGYRPAEDSLYGASTSTASSAAGRVDVLANGNVIPQAGLNALIGMDSVLFRAA